MDIDIAVGAGRVIKGLIFIYLDTLVIVFQWYSLTRELF